MARRKPKHNDGPFKPKHTDRWAKLIKPENNVRNLGQSGGPEQINLPIIPGKTNQLWRWDTMEDINEKE